ncbi:MAG: sodium:proline symporter [Chlamydia sp. 32-24]|nr:MAG: sodium:proline symporter [Chlamydia sp. 32-24]
MNNQILLAFLSYFSILLVIGIIAHKKQKSAADFIMGNRSLNFWLTALSAHASDMSSWLFMAFPGAVFGLGLPKAWIAIGLILGMYANWQFIAQRLRLATEKYNSYTLPTFFENRFDDKSGVLRVLTASIAIFFLASYLSAGLTSMGILFESVFGINYYFGLSVATFVVVLYTFVGGFLTVAWTDLVQAIFLLFVIIIVPIIAFNSLPQGLETIQQAAITQNISLQLWDTFNLKTFLEIAFLAAWGLGYFGQPHIVTKFMGIKNPSEIHKSKYLGMLWLVLALGGAVLVGVVGIGYFPESLDNRESVFITMVSTLFTPYVAGFILCGILAANMSTMDSQILVCASVISEDFYKPLFRPQASSNELLKVSRFGVICTALFSLMMAFNRSATVLEAVRYAWSGLGCSFGPLVVLSLYSKKVNKYGAIAGIVTGGVFSGGWQFLGGVSVYDIVIPAEIPGFFGGLAMIYAVSYLTDKKKATVCNF